MDIVFATLRGLLACLRVVGVGDRVGTLGRVKTLGCHRGGPLCDNMIMGKDDPGLRGTPAGCGDQVAGTGERGQELVILQ